MYGVSLNLLDFTHRKRGARHRFSLQALGKLPMDKDMGSQLFLSASNVAFMNIRKQFEFPTQLDFFDNKNKLLDVGEEGEHYPVYDEDKNMMFSFLNQFGAIPSDDYLKAPMSGMIFEEIFCIDFSSIEWDRLEAFPQTGLLRSEEEEPAGLSTSEGFDFGQYRVTISLVPEENT